MFVKNESDIIPEGVMTYVPVNHQGLLSANEKVNVYKEDRIANLNPITHNDKEKYEISIRSIMNMDQEPMHFLKAMSGSTVVTTNEYLQRAAQMFQDDATES
jgi:hypothetical protein